MKKTQANAYMHKHTHTYTVYTRCSVLDLCSSPPSLAPF